jgi:hypothetical protein
MDSAVRSPLGNICRGRNGRGAVIVKMEKLQQFKGKW